MSVLSLKRANLTVFRFYSVKKILTVLGVWLQRSHMRHQLSQLPDYRLKDIGISQEEALLESQKPFWEK